ncbi:MAG TPA: DNA-processing protein DprA [Patescibacteria group bacterium]|nr:DNA-processing protein DprA [Patescibacteria group bacterium]
METMYLAALQMVPGIGNARIKALVAHFGCARQAWMAERRDLFLSPGMDPALVERLLERRAELDLDVLWESWRKKGINACVLTDEEYPALLRKTFNPPYVLYYRGNLPATENLFAIVGARRASGYGKSVAENLAAELAANGFGVVSGAAKGIDAAAHAGALVKGYTAAVLGCGVDVVYPAESRCLLSEIAERGCVLSEYPPGTPARPGQFPARNRIISGLSKGVVVVEAAERSGALITADFALEEGRDVFAVPGSIFAEGSRGTHRLIKQGARLLDSVEDILEDYRQQPVASGSINKIAAASQWPVTVNEAELGPEEKPLYQLLRPDVPLSAEEIVLQSDLPLGKVLYLLLQLELRGWIVKDGSKGYLQAVRRVNK